MWSRCTEAADSDRIMFEPAAAAINHLLRDAPWARERLAPFAGSTVQCELPPVSATFAVDGEGYLRAIAPEAQPTVSVRSGVPNLLRLLWLRDDSARRQIRIVGDAAFAAALSAVIADLRWDVEEDLSRVVGDVAAHRLARGGSALLQWQAQTANNFAQSWAEYWTEEQPLIASREGVREFVRDVDALRDDVERLEQRIERLSHRLRRP